jgi:hypothetical protein
MEDKKQPENAEYFNNMTSITTSDARYTCEFKSSSAIQKATFKRKKNQYTSKSDLNLRKKTVKFYSRNIAFLVLKLGHFGK